MVLPDGIRHISSYLDNAQQLELIETIRAIAKAAPLFTPIMPKTGKAMSVRITNCGPLGWVTDKANGYRYQKTHPVTGELWPGMPKFLLKIWNDISGYEDMPEACLINFYNGDAKMGLHQDRDEKNFNAPVVSISLGDDCLFRIGGKTRKDPTKSIRLKSGDIIILGGKGRLSFHGVDRIYQNTSSLLKRPGRINLTLRRVT